MFASTRIRASVIGAIACTALAAVLLTKGQGKPMPVDRETAAAAVGTDDLTAAARTTVFFEHQSVGMNVIDGIPAVYAAHGLPAPKVVALPTPAEPAALASAVGQGGSFAHAFFGQNGDPFAKVADFDARIRGGLGREVDVAFMKLCYVDVTRDTDVDALFARYRATMAALERDFPAVTFLHVTTPVTTEPSLKTRVKALLGRDDHLSPEDNAARERLNDLMRKEYGEDRLFDLAAVEATAPDGSRVSGSHDGQGYLAMWSGYAADAGHLNAGGSTTAAAQLLRLVGRAARS